MDSYSNNKKIIIVGPAYPYRGGNALFVSQVYEKLKNNFTVKVFNYKLLYPSVLFPGTTQFDKSDKQVFNIPSERLLNSISPFNWFKVAKKIISEDADLIVFDWWHPFFGPALGTITRLIKKKYKDKILFITENVVSHESNRIDKLLTKYGLKHAAFYLSLSAKVANELQTFSKGRKIFRSELPVYDCYQSKTAFDLQGMRTQLGIPENSTVLLFFGYVRKYKGLDILLKAMPSVLKKHPDAYLLIVGEFYDKPDSYFEIINKNNLNDKVKLVNSFVPNEDVEKYYAVSDLVILPYRSATQSGILNVAYGFKKPVVVTDVGGLAEFVEDSKTGFIVKPDSPAEIERGINKFYNLREKEDFAFNIEERNKLNSFENLPVLFNNIIENIKK